MTLSELKRLKALEEENARLKRIVDQQVLDVELPNEINSKNGKRSRLAFSSEVSDKGRQVFRAESFFDKLIDECLNCEVFRNGQEAQVIVGNWGQEYDNYRTPSSLDYLTLAEFARRYYGNKQKRLENQG